MPTFRSLDDADVKGKRVLVRVDLNVPMQDGKVSDSTRIEEIVPTITELADKGGKIILLSHFDRPKGRDLKYSLRPVAAEVARLVKRPVAFADDCIGPKAEQKAAQLKTGQMLLLENLRFHPGEEGNDRDFAKALRRLAADAYVNDAFGASHRAHASIEALPLLYETDQTAGGLLLAREIEFLQKITEASDRPFVALLGGAKIAGKIEPLEALAKQADTLLVGGGMANTFLAAKGINMGASLVDKESIEVAKRISWACALNRSSRWSRA